MLGIPFLDNFVTNAVKRHEVADSVDHLNSYITALVLGFFAIATSAKQYFGTPIKCWAPSEYSGSWENYAEDYCFISSSYQLPEDHEISVERDPSADHYSYYRWVPVMLAIQAVCFCLPNYIWMVLHKKTRISPLVFLKEADKIAVLTGQKREEEVGRLANYFMETVSVFGTACSPSKTTPRSGKNAMMLYLFTKGLYVLNIYLQVTMLNCFLGDNYLHWGYQLFWSFLSNSPIKGWTPDGEMINYNQPEANGIQIVESPVFPKVILCDFAIRKLGNVQKYTLQCVMMMNMINEKLYLFLYFWLIILAVITLLNFFYYLAILLFPRLRVTLVMVKLDDRKKRPFGFERRALRRFVNECLHPDGVLLLQFLSEHSGGRLTYDLANKILSMYSDQDSISDDASARSYTLEHSKRPLHCSWPPSKTTFHTLDDINSNDKEEEEHFA